MPPAQRTEMRRLGVLTFHRCINYGSYWQARCLVEGLRRMGVEAELLDHESPRVTWAELRCALSPTLPQRTPRSDFPAYARKTRKFREAFERLPLSRRFPIDRPEEMGDYDAVIVGSDEVWNLRHPWYGGCSAFYGKGVRGTLISYAASFGNQNASEGLSDHWASQIGNFASISVRDQNSRRMIRTALGHDPDIVLDPCLQFPGPAARRGGSGEGYVALYGHNFPEWFCLSVRNWARTRGLPIRSIGYRNDWADEQWLEAGPLEFAELMAGADAVVTNFFHGCVFALLNGRPFVTAPSAYRMNKVRDLLWELGAEGHMILPEDDDRVVARSLDEPPASAVQQRIDRLRAQSGDFLRRALAMPS
ncbi:polysaccharide pyruvyl transferase family protein [Sphingobium sp. SA916]|uniref:polysaccharide pyruvyl transferase family protein n=1 Tax=Sphingobium sp. SA916 TaxID=1851207 RepID=UPI000C9F0845|nr:polysaccharide pyruvyl transferase family protein [Sphingobium sp. SA916]PNQ04888.1 polysaccharide pyruvyl transferase [Sphingobium sp. SA916]